MIILGLHFGHDATISIVKDGEILTSIEIERINRIKHSIGIDPCHVETVLKDENIDVSEIDFCSLTSTQGVQYILCDKKNLDISFDLSKEHSKLPCTLTNKLGIEPEEFIDSKAGWLQTLGYECHKDHAYQTMIPHKIKESIKEENMLGGFENFVWAKIWEKKLTLKDIENCDYSKFLDGDDVRHGFHYPCTVNLFGKKIPSFIFSHHYAHIAYSFYSSNFEDSAVISCDGGGSGYDYKGGFFAYGNKNKLYPIIPHNLSLGPIQDGVPMKIGLAMKGGAGKMMGLSAYGKPKFFEHKFIGNWFENDKLTAESWIEHCKAKAKALNYNLDYFGKSEHVLKPINVDIAASTQKLTEEIMLYATSCIKNMLNNNNLETKNLSLSGGVSLNCPANSRMYNEGQFDNIFVPPGVGDSGLATGSALALYYNIMDCDRKVSKVANPMKIAYLGLRSSSSSKEVKKYLKQYDKQILVEEGKDIHIKAAERLKEDKIIAWFDGRSELGPRALGHRSIIANAGFKENWKRVNKIKKRELWRPFAPIVLERLQDEYFSSTQLPSYYMLLNAQVRSNEIPAVSHVDGSARVQSVNKNNGSINDLLEEFYNLTKIPVLMNTSFNGPGEPVIETVEQAIKFLLSTDLDFLYVNNKYQISRKV